VRIHKLRVTNLLHDTGRQTGRHRPLWLTVVTRPTLLITMAGLDRPGVTASLFEELGNFPVDVLDLDQMVLRGRLILGILVTAPRDPKKLIRAIETVASDLSMDCEVVAGEGDTERPRQGLAVVTVLGGPLRPRAVGAIAGRIADTGANIDRIVRIAAYPVTALELHVSGTDVHRLRTVLAREAAAQEVDVAVQRVGLIRHGRRLIVMDVDSTLIQGEVIDMLAAKAGVAAEVAEITDRAMSGEFDFEEAVRARVRLLKGLPESVVDEVYDELELAPGARTLVRTLHRLGYLFAIVSGGFTHLTDRLSQDLGIDYAAANRLEVIDGALTGELSGRVIDRAGKAKALRRFARHAKLTIDRTVAIGDGANDVDMLDAAGLGIAFNAKPMVRDSAHTAVNVPYLDTIMYLLGITRSDIESDDAEHGIITPAPPVP
jgi:phosphoserine phosphatase